MPASVIAWIVQISVVVAIVAVTYPLAQIPVNAAPSLGHRGNRRQQMLRRGGSFCAIEPLMRLVASWFGHLGLSRYRDRLEQQLLRAGDYLGITADEYLALSALSALLFGLLGGAISQMLDSGFVFAVVGALVGAFLPHMQLQGEIRRRAKAIDRGLPASIDLAALCMGAGLDFPGALNLIANGCGSNAGVIEEEFLRILRELDLGHTRKQALREFERRVPTRAVRDFVGAVIQAEQKGNPLADVLRIQAQVLRMQRSVAAEEAAARAGVLMMAPLFLLLCCILALMLGPFIINGIEV